MTESPIAEPIPSPAKILATAQAYRAEFDGNVDEQWSAAAYELDASKPTISWKTYHDEVERVRCLLESGAVDIGEDGRPAVLVLGEWVSFDDE